MTMTAVIFCLLLGALLAQRYTVLAILPATPVVVIGLGSAGMTTATTGFWSLLTIVIVAAVSIQIGYFVGLACAHCRALWISNKLPAYTAHPTSTQNSAR
ncbi:exported hypothetical protein [Bradyrhizobium sp. STM 3843]|uniref:hypothetical protein n=1 Tax=Bradyrhizobium sp. STM 3843 TaxID=551947 RepID=UPI000240AF17|nr:hypothetical protein [Bradyrhizobium sp. STM 3843]CCE05698.1 exported hypothetical protein [Bradyrhizobium sp. STM 3843]